MLGGEEVLFRDGCSHPSALANICGLTFHVALPSARACADSGDIQPPSATYERRNFENIYALLEPARFVACPEDIWQPLNKGEKEQGEEEIKGRSRNDELIDDLKLKISVFLDNRAVVSWVTVMTCWALFMDDLQLALPMIKDVDEPFASAREAQCLSLRLAARMSRNLCRRCNAVVTLTFLTLFSIEQILRSFAQLEYRFSFFWCARPRYHPVCHDASAPDVRSGDGAGTWSSSPTRRCSSPSGRSSHLAAPMSARRRPLFSLHRGPMCRSSLLLLLRRVALLSPARLTVVTKVVVARGGISGA